MAAALVAILRPGPAGARSLTATEGPGVALTPSTVLHTTAGTEFGVDSNPGYTTDGGAAGFFRFVLKADYASRPPQRLTGPGTPARRGIDFRVGLAAERREYVSPSASAVSAWQFDETARLDVNPQGPLGGSLTALYSRSLLPKNYEPLGTYMRDAFACTAAFALRPRHARMSYALAYDFVYDWYESARLDYAKSERHTVRLGVRREIYYRLSAMLDLSVGHIGHDRTGGPLDKADSTPLTVTLGVAGILRPRLTATLKLGYMNGFYERLPTLQNDNLSYPYVETAATWQVIPYTGRLTGGYALQPQDALMGNYYVDHLAYLGYDQLLVVPRFKSILFSARAAYRHRGYHGEPVGFASRDDDILQLTAGVDLPLKEWLYTGLGYDMSADFTSFRDPAGIPYRYVKHELFVKVQVAY